ncbi:hypothetical protein [Streptomyces silvisoli]|uniref:IS1 family transposase n=1 Tax=Streptomyces silvisoli TaxID=3034235 RepID=A0ABT5ZIG3_9ACTN|nr:hypothetical protein [Streptomyces silvisoli]MDF3289619.1 hypothetical protein [Streptomyces silvisoli]
MAQHRADAQENASAVDPAQFAREEFRILAPIRPTISKVSCPHCPGAAFFDGTSGWVCMKCGPVFGATLHGDGLGREASLDDSAG